MNTAAAIPSDTAPVSNRVVTGFLIVLALGAIVAHAATLSQPPYWLDEVGSVASMHQSLGDMIQTRVQKGHQPLYFSTAWVWAKAFGTNAQAMRALSLVFVVVAAVLCGATARRLAGPLAGWFVVVLVLLNPNVYQFSHLFRPYAMVLMWSALLIYATVVADRLPGLRSGVFVAVAALLAMLTHYSATFAGVAVFLYGLTLWRKGLTIMLGILAAFVIWGPWAFWCTQQFDPDSLSGGIPPANRQYLVVVPNMLFDLGGTIRTLVASTSLVLLAALILGAVRAGRVGRLLLMLYALPLLIGAVLMFVKDKNIFGTVRYFGVLLAAQPVLYGLAVIWLVERWRRVGAATGVCFILVAVFLFGWRMDQPRNNSSWDRMADHIRQAEGTADPVVTLRSAAGFEMAYQLDLPVARLATPEEKADYKTRPGRLYQIYLLTPGEIIAGEDERFWLALSSVEMPLYSKGSFRGRVEQALADLPGVFEVSDVKRYPAGMLIELTRKPETR